jgi:hypothetical protein
VRGARGQINRADEPRQADRPGAKVANWPADAAFPPEIADELRGHLECFAEPGEEGLVFVDPLGSLAPVKLP